jgi:hypothetical protein
MSSVIKIKTLGLLAGIFAAGASAAGAFVPFASAAFGFVPFGFVPFGFVCADKTELSKNGPATTKKTAAMILGRRLNMG